MNKKKTVIYSGCADIDGIETFSKGTELSWSYYLRSKCKAYRKACYYRAEIEKKDVQSILDLLEKENAVLALFQLKKVALKVVVSQEQLCFWEQIPAV
jgi:hypothetical protein